jgi:hypothetical protein
MVHKHQKKKENISGEIIAFATHIEKRGGW